MATKTCIACGLEKSVDEYRIRKDGGRRGECRQCEKDYMKEYGRKRYAPIKAKHIEERAARRRVTSRVCRTCHKDKPIGDFRRFTLKNREYRKWECCTCEAAKRAQWAKTDEGRRKTREWSKNWAKTPKGSAYCKDYFRKLRVSEDYKEKVRKDPRRKESARRWLSKPESKAYRAEWYRNKRKTDPRYRVSNGFSRSVRRGLKNGKGGVSWKTMVGYSVDQLMAHLEAQFLPGMTWDNYGRAWHIDHRLPVSSFSFSSYSDDGFKKCWCLSNLSPMWALDNIRKGAKIL
jgi:hypothetical protein